MGKMAGQGLRFDSNIWVLYQMIALSIGLWFSVLANVFRRLLPGNIEHRLDTSSHEKSLVFGQVWDQMGPGIMAKEFFPGGPFHREWVKPQWITLVWQSDYVHRISLQALHFYLNRLSDSSKFISFKSFVWHKLSAAGQKSVKKQWRKPAQPADQPARKKSWI